jgi:hypothetical protein
LPELQQPSKLTHLSFSAPVSKGAQQVEQLQQLSTLVGLQHLKLTGLPRDGLPDGFPPQLAKLTCLDVSYINRLGNAAVQFKHLSSFTVLRDLRVRYYDSVDLPAAVPSLGGLSQLTELRLDSYGVDFSPPSTRSLSSLTALQSLHLSNCALEPPALAAIITQLRAVSFAQLRLLTELPFSPGAGFTHIEEAQALAAFTALTFSTQLCSLQLDYSPLGNIDQGLVLFQAGTTYPGLRTLGLRPCDDNFSVPVDQQQRQLLHSCCPAVESVAIVLRPDMPRTAVLPLLQLTALTCLDACVRSSTDWRRERETPSTACSAALVDVAVQLTKLQRLTLVGLPMLAEPSLVQLTALTALEQIQLYAAMWAGGFTLTNTVSLFATDAYLRLCCSWELQHSNAVAWHAASLLANVHGRFTCDVLHALTGHSGLCWGSCVVQSCPQ